MSQETIIRPGAFARSAGHADRLDCGRQGNCVCAPVWRLAVINIRVLLWDTLPKGQPSCRLKATSRNHCGGRGVYEPAQTVIARFDNASQTEPMKFIPYYLLEANEPLIELLPDA